MDNEKEKKPNIFKKLKRWWKEELTEDDRTWMKCVGIWTVDGLMIGSMVTAGVKNAQTRKIRNQALAAGYIQGQMDAYKEMAQNPYGMMNAGMQKLEQKGIAKKF